MFRHAFRLWMGNIFGRHTKIKLAFLLFVTNLTLLLGGYINGDNWEAITVWLFGTYAAGNVGATFAHAKETEVIAAAGKDIRDEEPEERKGESIY